jgi:hypothetical protein
VMLSTDRFSKPSGRLGLPTRTAGNRVVVHHPEGLWAKSTMLPPFAAM